MIKRKKLNSLQSLRFYCCLVIYLSHIGITYQGLSPLPTFFVLSGFISAYTFQDNKDSWKPYDCFLYGFKRNKKSYFFYLITLVAAIALALVKIRFNHFDGAIIKENFFIKVISHIFLVQTWIPNTEYYCCFNGPAWFLASICFISIFTPWLIRLLKRVPEWIRLFFCVPVLLFLHTLFTRFSTSIWGSDWTPFANTPLYIAGLIVGLMYLENELYISEDKQKLGRAVLEIVLVGLSLFYWFGNWWPTAKNGVTGNLMILFLILGLALDSGPIATILNNPVTVHLGDISMEIYLSHLVVFWYVDELVLILSHRNIDVPRWQYQILRFVLVFAFSEISHWLLPKLISKAEGKLKRNTVDTK